MDDGLSHALLDLIGRLNVRLVVTIFCGLAAKTGMRNQENPCHANPKA